MGNTKIYGVIGPIISSVAEAVGLTAKNWNLAMVSPSAISVLLNDRQKYPYFYRSSISDDLYMESYVAIIKHFNWTDVAVVYEASTSYSPSASNFILLLEKNNVTVSSSQGILHTYDETVKNFKDNGVRIIFGLLQITAMQHLACAAYKAGLYGNKYLWVLPGWYYNAWYEISDPKIGCTTDQIYEVINHYLATYRSFNRYDNKTETISGKTPWKVFQYFRSNSLVTHNHDHMKGYTYDAVWILAMALNKTDAELKKRNQSLLDFNYSDKAIMAILNESLTNTSFNGVTGHVCYDGFERIEDVHILQLPDRNDSLEMVPVGIYDIQSKSVSFYKDNPITWPAGVIPKSPPEVLEVRQLISYTAGFIFACLATCGIITAIGFFIFNILHKNQKQLKLSCPRLNNVLIIGCIICYLDVIVFTFETAKIARRHMQILCQAKIWLICTGFTLVYGSLFAKTWRIHKIFTNKTSKAVAIKDWQLIAIVCMLLFIDILIFIIWNQVNPMEEKRYIISTKDGVDPRYKIQSVYYFCSCENLAVWLATICVIKFVLLVFGSFLAFETRNINITGLNDSKYIAFSIYNILIFCILGLIAFITVTVQVTTSYCLISSCIIICTTTTMLMLFVPKILAWKNQWNHVHQNLQLTAIATVAAYNEKCLASSNVKEVEKLQSVLQQLPHLVVNNKITYKKYKRYHKLHQELVNLNIKLKTMKQESKCGLSEIPSITDSQQKLDP
ncbi:uncharacterized protein TRIADDRAFT_55385 [Trichoplax adhaerens]|uniref:Gamma-aminobutyric acid type B receptor subunit 2 n=1 Tax=Trichoplax adhaerens TaxID=10228 RepID=B3RUR6_TRIAD|nr:hypothetical protein TRIADDRAFT_55385 [Trichoplax adhaerens]EDV25867.1 hypothetical protein TRIADDRAFT_55385 [Trichoplax adhaerens]|eukprot:XP_002111900.1 hypothetical protein TRIADDRAFT_55385 [Trichoplax adhaerens]